MTTIDRVGSSSPQAADSARVVQQQDQEKQRQEKVRVEQAKSEDAVVSDVKPRSEIRDEDEAFRVAASLKRNIEKQGIEAVNAQNTSADSARELLA